MCTANIFSVPSLVVAFLGTITPAFGVVADGPSPCAVHDKVSYPNDAAYTASTVLLFPTGPPFTDLHSPPSKRFRYISSYQHSG